MIKTTEIKAEPVQDILQTQNKGNAKIYVIAGIAFALVAGVIVAVNAYIHSEGGEATDTSVAITEEVPVIDETTVPDSAVLFKADFSEYKGANFTESAANLGLDSLSIVETDDGFYAQISGSGIIAYFRGELSVAKGMISDSSECYKLTGKLSDFVNITSSMKVSNLAIGSEEVEEIWVQDDYASLELDTDYDGVIDTRLIIYSGSEVSPSSETELTWEKII